jgi:hypothetical protein
MITHCTANLRDLKSMLSFLDRDQYVYKSALLSNSSIGQHIRHILEFYICLIKGYPTGLVNYDKRERNNAIENGLMFALASIDEIDFHLRHIHEDSFLELEANFGQNNQQMKINSSLYRELAYCLEHSIHHQALIKIALIEQQCGGLVGNDFGVAPATLRYKVEVEQ